MVNSFEIKTINNENILYLYFDFNYEIASLNLNSKKDKLKEIVKSFKKYTKSLKIATIVLVASGIVIGQISLNKPNNDIPLNNNVEEKVYVSDSVFDSFKIDSGEKSKESVNVENKENVNQVDHNVIEEKTNNYIESKEVITNNNYTEPKVVEQTENTEVVDNNIYVTVRRSNGQVINIELEEYIIGVVGAEMPASFNIEALKSQSIIARTYALKARSRGITLTDNESTQSYKSNYELQNMWGSSYNTYYNKIKSAVDSTSGMYLTYNGTYIEAVYHSTSNTKTEDAKNVWGNYYPYLVSVDSSYDTSNPSFYFEKFITYDELSNKLGFNVDINTNFDILSYTISNRVDSINIGGNIYTGVSLRNKLGLRSADFEIDKIESGVTFKTRGYGHGVGMSQYGANGMAKAGYNYEEILKHYYQGVSINHI